MRWPFSIDASCLVEGRVRRRAGGVKGVGIERQRQDRRGMPLPLEKARRLESA
jgi:hypothetical protein